MIMRTTRVNSTRANTYLMQLCKHFEQRVQVQFDGDRGQITFPFCQCKLTASDAVLDVVLTAEYDAEMCLGQRVMSNHIDRFAFRERPHVSWQ
ncbi:hypothetical protein SAMN06273572_102256 [Monaibacterium marinum]|uniref:DUF2218 domain-containing protein n=1 Tax=Pontivivens marinum TaxID=1690039 RepID=A0A2C9CT76_9RHOB|nr:DUF2218 domain-containing protein [Monaibacterium marinum]SOH93579.1 hypothetical protein SAMN06273572_102256 [Monaibacterium marinum]